ncbi:uncharacterized protein EV420DRAFT_1757822 [Desarmillaria tabescens]|uniref:F-box domain-containing protein n=1 Tax=Armillaria tabescens TaxID=1929756 RepID=A0AA39NQZ7_ARMTA|nr:uncharacterized protein EV420DRAFT_1757822 [Desarmillaria tabescens]KAK0470259.1 hypothetical protein EV420DRAFT_1757822 [Desarmillaria tabescens]
MSPPDIPTDVIYEILLQYGVRNLSFLWLNCRPVSRNFKDAVERVFVTKHLRKTWLRVDTGEHDAGVVELQFYSLDPDDSSRAIFESYECQESLEWALRHASSLEHPNVIIQVRHAANDTMLPDLRYHFDPAEDVEFEVSFDWKGMYSHFFREREEVQRRLDERYRSVSAEAARGSFLSAFTSFRRMALGVDYSRISRAVRAERTRRNVLESEGREVSGDDRLGFEKLERKKDLVAMEDPYSDEGGAGEDEDGVDGEEDEDEDSEADESLEEDDEDENGDDCDSNDFD